MLPRANWKRPWEDVGDHPRQTTERPAQGWSSSGNPSRPDLSRLNAPCPPRPTLAPVAGSCPISFVTNSHCAPAGLRMEEASSSSSPNSHPYKRPRIQDDYSLSVSSGSAESTAVNPQDSPNPGSDLMRKDLGRKVEREDGARQTSPAHVSLETHKSVPARPESGDCRWCGHCRHVLQTIVSELAQFELGKKQGMTNAPSACPLAQAPDARYDIHQCLEWVLGAIRNDISLVRDRMTRGEGSKLASVSMTGQSGGHWTNSAHHEGMDKTRPYEIEVKVQRDGRARSATGEASVPARRDVRPLSQPSGPIVAQSYFQGPAPSPYAQPSPSFSDFSFERDNHPPRPPSSQASLSAEAAHLRDLQHQVSTKTLALQSLQQEHEHLFSALSRSQTRCAALDKKFQVSDVELNKLTEERISLQAQVEALESQVEELTKARDDARAQSVANGGQYIQIMSMASRLEAQNAAEKKKSKIEREAWEQTEEELKRRIAQLEKDKEQALRLAAPDVSPPPGFELANASAHFKTKSPFSPPAQMDEVKLSLAPANARDLSPSSLDVKPRSGEVAEESDAILCSTSVDDLRAEVVRLRDGCRAMGAALQDIKSEGYRVDQLIQKFGNIGKRVVTKSDAASRFCRQYGGTKPAVGDDGATTVSH